MTTILIQKYSLVSILACLSIATIAAGDRAGGGSPGPAGGDCVSRITDVESQCRWQIKPTRLHQASALGFIEFVYFYLVDGDNIEALDRIGRTPLLVAAENGHAEVVTMLLDKGANIHAAQGPMPFLNHTALYLAASNGHYEVVKILLNRGARVNIEDGEKNTPLHFAAKSGNISVVNILIEFLANVSATNHLNWSPLHWATYHGHVDVVRRLITAGADPSATTLFGETPLALAECARGTDGHSVVDVTGSQHEEVIKLLKALR